MRVEKKAWPEYFQAILEGKKTFDLRIADFQIAECDILVLKEWDPKTQNYTGRILEKQVTHVLKTKDLAFWSKDQVDKYGYQVLSLK